MIPLAISAVGLTSSLGLGAEEACAAARAGLIRVSPIVTLNTAIDPAFARETLDGVPAFVGHLAPTVATGHAGIGKLMALGKPALEEMLRQAGLSKGELLRTGLCLVIADDFYHAHFGQEQESIGEDMPPSHKDVWDDIAQNFGNRLCGAIGLPIREANRWTTRTGRLGLLDALEQASMWITEGQLDRCAIGTIESCVEPSFLLASAAARALKTDANPVGFMPGEAAAFLLVEPTAARGSTTASVDILSVSQTKDAPYLDADASPRGRGISDVITQLALAAGEMPPLLITDLNGTDFRASDWGHALVHVRDCLGEFDTEVWLPVESFGETGAATGGISLCMAFEGARRGHVPSGTALLILCADEGGRGGLLMETRTSRN